MRKIKILLLPVLFGLILIGTGCGEDKILLFSLKDDKQLGMQVSDEIASDPAYTILSETEYQEAYSYLNNMRDEILNADEVRYRDEFVWKMHIIQDDDVLNAFATPGGYIYIYTGLIKFLETEDDLAGVMGHEIAHSDRRHSSQQLQRQYGISILLGIVTGGDPGTLAQIAGQIAGTVAGLSFSRSLESEADEYSVLYLADTKYACNGAATFFEKLEEAGTGSSLPAFLSTHPPSDTRVQEINAQSNEIGCSTQNVDPPTYEDLLTSLP